MKRSFPAHAGIILIAFLVSSCSWFNRKPVTAPALAGTWRLDSLSGPNDSPANPVGLLLFAMAHPDSTALTCTFEGDSVRVADGSVLMETSAYRYEKPVLTILDSAKQQLEVIRLTDSALVLRGSDSAQLFLSRN